MRNKNNTTWSMLAVASACLACTTAQQSAAGSTSTSPSPGAGATSSANTALPPAEPRAAAGSMGVDEVANQTVGVKVTVSGVFMGFNGACLGDAPSRSAWHLAASKDPKAPCVYVDGPFPPGLSPAVHAGTNTTVTGTVAQLGNTHYLLSTGD